jgi:hypothetical protein
MYAQCLSESWLDTTIAKLSDEEARVDATLAAIAKRSPGCTVAQLVAERLSRRVQIRMRVLTSCASSPAMPVLVSAIQTLLSAPHAPQSGALFGSFAAAQPHAPSLATGPERFEQPAPQAPLLGSPHTPLELAARLRSLRTDAGAHVDRALAELRALLVVGFAAALCDEDDGDAVQPTEAAAALPQGAQPFGEQSRTQVGGGGGGNGGFSFGLPPAAPPLSAAARKRRALVPAVVVRPKLCLSCFPACVQLALDALERAVDTALDAARAACACLLDAALDPASDAWLLIGWRQPRDGRGGGPACFVKRACAQGDGDELESALAAACLLNLPDRAALAACLPSAAQLALAADEAGGADADACTSRLREQRGQLRLARAKLLLAFEPALVASRTWDPLRPVSGGVAGGAKAVDAFSAADLDDDEGLVSRVLGELALGAPAPAAGGAPAPAFPSGFGAPAQTAFGFAAAGSSAGPFSFNFL